MTFSARGAAPLRAAAFLSLLLPACLAPRSDPQATTGTTDELGDLMRAGGAEPVLGSEEPGATGGIAPGQEAVDPDLVGSFGQEPEPVEKSPYIRFGERIILRELEDGTTLVTKPYFLPIGRPEKIVQLMGALEPFAHRRRPDAPQDTAQPPTFDPTVVEFRILAQLDEEFYTVFPNFDVTPTQPTSVPLSDVMVVTATPPKLAEFEDFLDLFSASGVPQIEIEAKIIEIVERDSLDVGVSPTFTFATKALVDTFAADLPNFAEGTEALLTLGAIQDGVVFDAIIEAVKNWQNVTIEARPKTVVRAGGVARIDSTTEIPFLQITTLTNATFTTAVDYKVVGTQLWIPPRMVGANTLALDVHLQGSQQVGSEVTLAPSASETGPIEAPVIAKRTAKTVVYLEPGQTLVIGGLTQTREQEIMSKVPILGDIPILGWLFRSSFRLKERQHVLFAISPRIIQRSDFDTEL